MMRNRTWCLPLLLASALGCSERGSTPPEPAGPTCPSFVPANDGLPDAGEWRTHPSIGDVNEDGLADLVALPRKLRGPGIFLSDGLGSWEEASEALQYKDGFSCGVGTRLADLNLDGHLDLVLADHCQGLLIFHGDGAGGWTAADRGVPRNLDGFNDADVGDLNGDGWPDIVALSAFTRGFLVLAGSGNGAWSVVRDTGLPEDGSGWQVELADVSADGLLDVVTTYNPTSTNRRRKPHPPAKVWLQQPAMRFRPASGFEPEGRYFGLALRPRRGHAVPDLILGVYGYHAGLYLYRSETGESWSRLRRLDQTWFEEIHKGFAGVRVDDVNGDGCDDIIANEGTTLSVLLAVGDCAEGWTLCPWDTIPRDEDATAGWGLAVGDLNADGRPDVVAGLGTHQGKLRAWFQVDPATAAAWRAQGQGQGPLASRAARAPDAPAP